MKKILIFKTDKLGDLLNITPVIYNIKSNYPDCIIDLVCSNYNYSIAKYFTNDLNIIIYKKPVLFFLLSNFKKFFIKGYDAIIQLDGKNHSYLSAIFIKSKKKVCIQVVKEKYILGKSFFVYRPGRLIKFFFSKTQISFENYNSHDNKKYHYLTLYLKLISSLGLKIVNNEHYFPTHSIKRISRFDDQYFYIHIDERWNNFEKSVFENINSTILYLSQNNKVVISSNINGNKIFNKIAETFKSNLSIEIIHNPKITDMISLIYFSHTCVSSHSGLVVHLAAAFNKKIIDIVSKNIFNQLDRWIPFNVKYKRVDIKNFNYKDLKF